MTALAPPALGRGRRGSRTPMSGGGPDRPDCSTKDVLRPADSGERLRELRAARTPQRSSGASRHPANDQPVPAASAVATRV